MCSWVSACRFRILFVLLFCFSSVGSALCAENEFDCPVGDEPRPPVEPVTLRVALYPYTPDRIAIFQKLESAFECAHDGVNVVLISTSNTTTEYYESDDKERKGFQFADADIYEIDTILLAEFIEREKIQPVELPFYDFAPEGVAAVTRDGKIYGVPHWLCGNFLFYKRSDTEIRDAESWHDLLTILAARKQSVLVDLRGSSILGEWYLTALEAIVGLEVAQKQIVEEAPVDVRAVMFLQRILAACPSGYCRSKALHDNVGSYARAFVRGEGAVYLGYSESIYFGLRELIDSCAPGSGCLRELDIGVRALPVSDPKDKKVGVGWVDALAIDSRLSGRKKDLAAKFIKLAVTNEMYQSMLTPEWPYASRYLLPARQGIQVSDAPLYSDFRSAHVGRATGTALQLNKKLRDVAGKVNCRLPIDRNDTDTIERCARN